MAKSLRSKVKRRYRTLKRGYVNEIKVKPETEQLHSRCQKALAGIEYREKEKKNAFLFPDDPEAHFPQYKPQQRIDLRSASIPGSGLEWSGARTKKEKEVEHLIPDDDADNQAEEMNGEQRVEESKTKNKNKVKQINAMSQQKNQKSSTKKNKKVSKLKKTFVF